MGSVDERDGVTSSPTSTGRRPDCRPITERSRTDSGIASICSRRNIYALKGPGGGRTDVFLQNGREQSAYHFEQSGAKWLLAHSRFRGAV